MNKESFILVKSLSDKRKQKLEIYYKTVNAAKDKRKLE